MVESKPIQYRNYYWNDYEHNHRQNYRNNFNDDDDEDEEDDNGSGLSLEQHFRNDRIGRRYHLRDLYEPINDLEITSKNYDGQRVFNGDGEREREDEFEIIDQADRKENELGILLRQNLEEWFNPEAELVDSSKVADDLRHVRLLSISHADDQQGQEDNINDDAVNDDEGETRNNFRYYQNRRNDKNLY